MMVIDTTGKVAQGFIEGLRSQPAVLALVGINLAFLALVAWMFTHATKANADWREMIVTMAKDCREAR